jgi:hypothetical protein
MIPYLPGFGGRSEFDLPHWARRQRPDHLPFGTFAAVRWHLRLEMGG